MKDKEKQIKYIDGKIYYNGEHIGYIEFSFYEDIKALGFGNFEIIDKRKGYGTLVIKDISDILPSKKYGAFYSDYYTYIEFTDDNYTKANYYCSDVNGSSSSTTDYTVTISPRSDGTARIFIEKGKVDSIKYTEKYILIMLQKNKYSNISLPYSAIDNEEQLQEIDSLFKHYTQKSDNA